MWKFLVKQQKIEVLEREVLADHQIAFVNLKFVFDGNWKKFHKVVQFSQCDETYSIVLGFDGTTCHLPAELHVGAVKMSVFGYDAESDTTIRATTVPVTLNIRESGFVGDDDTPIPPTPDLYTQLLQKITEIQSAVNGTTLTAEQLELLNNLQQFEDVTKYEIQTLRESVDPVISQAHCHHDLALLNSITAEKIAKWDSCSHTHENMEYLDHIQVTLSALLTSMNEQRKAVDAVFERRISALESKIANGNNVVTLFSAGADALALYGAELFTIYNNAYNSITDFSANYPHFLSADNNYQMNFSVDDFGWDGTVYIICTKELHLSEKSQISMCYQSGAAENGNLYLVPKPERNDVPISVYVYTQIQNGTAIKVPFQWLYSDSCITTLSDCNVSNGTYYFAFVGRSNNTHPMIKQIQVLN